MASPVEPLGEGDAREERDSDDDERVRTASAVSARLRPPAELRTCGRDARVARRSILRELAFRAGLDQARLQLPEEVGVVCERLGQFCLDSTLGRRALRELLQLIGRAIKLLVDRAHFFTGGCSPVAIRQIPEAARLAIIVAAAPIAPYKPVHISLRNMRCFSPLRWAAKPGYLCGRYA
jgi:hypothetical protein